MTIELENLSLRYGRRGPSALDGITATLGPGMHLLLGENGAGKTSLLHLIDGLRFPTSGKCLIDGGPTSLRLPSVLSKIFYLAAGMELPARSVEELVHIHAPFYPTFSPEMLDRNLADFNIDASMKFSGMSTGMRQKAAVAYALALRTPILLLDEPATALDITSIRTLQRMMARSIEPEQTVIVATHHFADLERLYDSLLVLRHGHLLLALPTERIAERLAFIAGPTDSALYSMPALGSRRSIIASSGEPQTDIDFELLYLALHNPQSAPEILKLLS